ncbi:putative iron-regulated membrane protein [alpha proteobacterium Q-1]|nr:putative iron-regulated membrane protein [alpha proteobacterium Q-1]
MSANMIKRMAWVHKWTSLICTIFLLMLCLTGLPLIFHDEIDDALNPSHWVPAHPDGAMLELDRILEIALQHRPDDVPIFMSFDTDRPVVNVTTGARPDVAATAMHFASFDRTSGDLVPPPDNGAAIMDFLLQIHTDLFLGLPGMLFLGAMGLIFLAAILSGILLYAPFMRKLDFGTVRASRSPRLKWLDYHNLLGVMTAAWVLVVGGTGVINTLAIPIIDFWKHTELADLIEPHGAPPSPVALHSLDDAMAKAKAAVSDMVLQFVAFPGASFSTDHHYAIYFHGKTPLTRQMTIPALIDARDGRFAGLRPMPWYVKTLALSQPLHFGDYGGLPLKIIWAVLDLITIIVLGSGLYLWLGKGGQRMDPAMEPLWQGPE